MNTVQSTAQSMRTSYEINRGHIELTSPVVRIDNRLRPGSCQYPECMNPRDPRKFLGTASTVSLVAFFGAFTGLFSTTDRCLMAYRRVSDLRVSRIKPGSGMAAAYSASNRR